MKRLFAFAVLATIFASCNSEPTLQKYFVEKTEDPKFIAFDISPTILNIDKNKLTAEQLAAIKSFEKINVLAFKISDSTKASYDAERTAVDAILKDEKYQELMHVGSGKDGASVSFVGDENHIDEFVLYAKRKENGFAVVRILGNDMNPNAIMTLMTVLKQSDVNMEQLKPLQEMFSKKL